MDPELNLDSPVRSGLRKAAVVFASMAMVVTPLKAAQTDISSTPITSSSSAQVKPNIMLLMDTSESMAWTHMPDEAGDDRNSALNLGPNTASPSAAKVGYSNSQCNLLYYDPTVAYILPKDANGINFPTPSFTGARYNGFDVASPLVNLGAAFKAFDDTSLRVSGFDDVPQAAYYHAYSGGPAIAGYADARCRDDAAGASATGTGTWSKVTVGPAEQANFAIWYSFYRLRILMVKTAASLAFNSLTDSFRVGFVTMNPKFRDGELPSATNPDKSNGASVQTNKFLQVGDFDSTQRNAWFNKLFSQKPGGQSPAREGLARVGRYYAGKTDGINTGMNAGGHDPVQYSCQQNFTIMTTDGYWNSQSESTGGGGVQLDGTTLVGQQDGTLTLPSGNSPRPIWDGVPDGKRTITNKQNNYRYSTCGVYFYKTDTQISRVTEQTTRSTSQTTRSTFQNLQSTSQVLRSQTQRLQSTTQPTQSTLQNLQSTVQNLRTTRQNRQSTAQTTQSTTQNRQSTTQNLESTNQNLQTTTQSVRLRTWVDQYVRINRQSTVQNLRSTTQNLQSTNQTRQQTTQNRQSTTQATRSTTQNRQSTTQTTQSTSQQQRVVTQNLRSTSQTQRSSSQTTRSTAQALTSTHQVLQSTSQTTTSTSQARRSTSQQRSCSLSSETCTPVAVGSCSSGGDIYCETVTTGPTLVASCTPESAAPGNNYTAVTCAFTNTGPTPVMSCTPQTANSGNSYTTTTCNTATNPPAPAPSCNPATANASNAYTSTTCSANDTGPTPSPSCTPVSASAGNAYTETYCGSNNSGPTAVQTCTPQTAASGNSWTTITCNSNTTSNVPVSSCSPQTAASGNNWQTVTCNTATTTDVPVSSCSPSGATGANAWTTTTCSNNNSGPTGVASCTPQTGTSGNAWTTVTCPVATTGPAGVSSCTPVAAGAGNGWTATTCGNNNTTNVPVASCTASGPTSGNGFTTTTCPAPVVTGPTGVASCAPQTASAANSWTTATCGSNNTTNVPVASCTASPANAGNGFTATTCPAPVVTGPTAVQTCTPVPASAGNSWTATTCPPLVTTNVPVASCTASGPTSGNSWTTTTCPAPNTTSNVPVASCAAAPAAAGNSWTATTCPTPNTTSNVAVTSCTASPAASGNNWTATTCPAPTAVSGPTRVQTCNPQPGNAGNGYQETYCVNGSSSVPSGTCVSEAASSANNWVTTTCDVVGPFTTPIGTCTPQTANAGNNWTTISCPPPNVTTNVPVAACAPQTATSANSWVTRTCPAPNTTTNVPVASCTASPAASGNNWTATTCNTATTGPTAVSSCSPVPASSGNAWTQTTCGSNNTTNVAVASCTPSGSTSGNAWTTTTCSTNDNVDVPVASCAPSGPTSGNAWVTTTCPTPATTTNVPVASCTASPAAGGNAWTATSCSVNAGGPTAVSSCTPVAASSGNGWTTTSCGSNNSGPTPVASCTASSPTAGNNWTTTTCSSNNTSNVPVVSCAAQTASAGNGWTDVVCTPVTTSNVPVQTCSDSPGTSANNWVTTTCGNNNVPHTPVGSCTPVTGTAGNGWVTTTCPVLTTGPTGVASCTAQTGNAGNAWLTATCNTANSGPVPTASCTVIPASASNSWTATTCPTVISGPTVVTTCTAAPANASNNYTSTTCTPAPGSKIQYATTTTVDVTYYSGGVPSSSEPTVTTTGPLTDHDGVCYPPGSLLPAPPAAQAPAWTTADASSYPGCTAWPCTESQALGGARSVNSLADVAQYYYVTDLRPATEWPANIANDDVPSVGNGPEDDRLRTQHMTTFSVALGVSGTLQYRPDYKRGTTTTGDFAAIRAGTKNWPLWPDPAHEPPLCNAAANPSTCYANNPSLWNDPRAIDDFWHAAVNGRGTYFSARNPTSVIAGLQEALAGIAARLASASGAGVSNLEPVPGDNFVYLGNYTTQKWTGDVQAKEIDLATGNILPTVVWSAQARLDTRTRAACDDRKIKLFRSGATDNLTNFTWNTRACDSSGNPAGAPDTGLNATEQANFGAAKVSLMSQYYTMTDGSGGTVDQKNLALDSNLVNFLRGQTGRAVGDFAANTTDQLYRLREHVLGDTVNGQPTYVRAPFSNFGDPGYAAFKVAQAGRTPMLYVPANDGMLHAFRAGTSTTDPDGGKEEWAFMPTMVLPNLWKLADNNYKNNHAYFVDGTPTVTDAYDAASSSWKTILVAGMNQGGKGYYALDITDPLSPRGLWEFKWNPSVCPATSSAAAGNTADCHIGYTFGRPVITKLSDGTWVAIVTSGYNNVNAPPQAGDGEGYLYILNAMTGAIRHKISTGVGDPGTPSGLAQINAFVEQSETSNTAVRLYGTDVLGNIWRFDVNDNLTPVGREATLIGTARDTSGNPQPITTRPELSELKGQPMIFVATGRLLGATDVSDSQQQSIYGIVDPLTGSPSFPSLRSALAPLALTQVGSGSGTYRTVACVGSTAQCASTKGWVLNLPDPGERVNVEMKLRSGTLVIGSNVPQISACVSGGYSWVNQLNYQNGLALPPGTGAGGTGTFAGNALNSVSEQISNALIVGLTVVKLPGAGGSNAPFTIFASGSNAQLTRHDGRRGLSPSFGRRISWREVLAN